MLISDGFAATRELMVTTFHAKSRFIPLEIATMHSADIRHHPHELSPMTPPKSPTNACISRLIEKHYFFVSQPRRDSHSKRRYKEKKVRICTNYAVTLDYLEQVGLCLYIWLLMCVCVFDIDTSCVSAASQVKSAIQSITYHISVGLHSCCAFPVCHV